jgi:hypothetical protein
LKGEIHISIDFCGHWIRDHGSDLVMLVMLTEDDPAQAVEMLIRRVCYFLIPFQSSLLSIIRNMEGTIRFGQVLSGL